MKNSVSLIIPNYNYAQYLVRRLSTVLSQTVPVAEIIFLDDASTDNSVVLAETLLKKQSIPYKIICNEKNEGVFAQWRKGIALASYDLIWIAEVDDICESSFLATLLPAFEDKQVALAYCQSVLVNEKLHKIGLDSDYKFEAYFPNPKIWQYDFVHNGYDAVQNNMLVMNPIVNVSACVFRKSSILENPKMQAIESYKMMGDWLFYVLLLAQDKQYKIAYFAQALNYFVRHTKSVSKQEKQDIYNQELRNIYTYFLAHCSPNVETQEKMLSVLLAQEKIEGLEILLAQFEPEIVVRVLYKHLIFQKSLSIYEKKLIGYLRKMRKKLGVEQFLKKIFKYIHD